MDQEETEILTRKRNRHRTLPPVQINDVEDPRSFETLIDRLCTELPPRNVMQEGDLVTVAQYRWSSERLNSISECELNYRVRMPQLASMGAPSARLMSGYRMCLNEKAYTLLIKQYLDTTKAMNSLGTRLDRWSATKTPRSSKVKET